MAVASERWLDEVLLLGSMANLDGQVSDFYALPPGLGDVAILWLEYRIVSIDVLATLGTLGVRAEIASSNQAAVVDILGDDLFKTVENGANALGIVANIVPDALTLWRQSEWLHIVHPEMDTDATPTGDAALRVKVVRVRPTVEARQPVRLVR